MTKSRHQRRIEKLMAKAHLCEVPPFPLVPDRKIRMLRAALIYEEARETIEALGFAITHNEIFERDREINIVDIVDSCCDLSVVTIGTLSAFGIPDSPVLKIVDKANMRKFALGHSYREDGKLIKPPNFKGPEEDISILLQKLAMR